MGNSSMHSGQRTVSSSESQTGAGAGRIMLSSRSGYLCTNRNCMHGEVLIKGRHVCHSCGDPVHPPHLPPACSRRVGPGKLECLTGQWCVMLRDHAPSIPSDTPSKKRRHDGDEEIKDEAGEA